MKIFVVNLDHCADRREYMSTQFKQLGVEGEFFPATYGANLDATWSKRCRSATYNMLMGNIGFAHVNEIASFASHYRLWQHCIALNQPIIILEDDVTLSKQFNQQLLHVTQLVEQLNYVRLIAMERDRPRVAINAHLECYLHYPAGAQGYALTPAGARQFIKYAKRWSEPVDIYLDKYWLHGLRPYNMVPEMVIHDEKFESLIGCKSTRMAQYLPKPKGVIKMCREIFVRPWQRYKKWLFEVKHPIIPKHTVEAWLRA